MPYRASRIEQRGNSPWTFCSAAPIRSAFCAALRPSAWTICRTPLSPVTRARPPVRLPGRKRHEAHARGGELKNLSFSADFLSSPTELPPYADRRQPSRIQGREARSGFEGTGRMKPFREQAEAATSALLRSLAVDSAKSC